jgi:hypothetical protein
MGVKPITAYRKHIERTSKAHGARVGSACRTRRERIVLGGRKRIVRMGVASHADPDPARDASTKCAISA